jgi:uncharacterized protein YyaL (SSP411 family)
LKDGSFGKRANRLISEKSPYLLQHAHNPVDWFPWGEEAFERARQEDKPVFLSIGYSTCHWCHVMENESFENEEVAAVLNRVFVCIKVDREERPDLDGFYMDVCELMTGSGGWPLTILMTPERDVFFAGTYIPKETRYGRTGIIELTEQVEDIWRHRRSDIRSIAEQVKNSLESRTKTTSESELGKDAFDDGYEKLALNFDNSYGGWGHGLKFPSATNIMFLLRHWRSNMSSFALKMVEKTLQHMRAGGVFDQIGYGFHRYATDEEWLIPHFEKMLHDQALLALAYAEAYQATKKDEYKQTVEEVLEYVLRDLASPEGGFYSAQDADSEGAEGKFYVWTLDQIKQILPIDADFAIKVFGVTEGGNFKIEAFEGAIGANILHLTGSIESLASDCGLSAYDFAERLCKVRGDLFVSREERVHPSIDDKVLTDSNGLIIAALARASQVLNDGKYLIAATKAADFVLDKMRKNGRKLLHTFTKGEASIEGFLDDYAFLIWGLTEIYEASFEERYLLAALDLAKIMRSDFLDEEKGGFYSTSKENLEKGIIRRKEQFDQTVPSGNAVAILDLMRLSRLTDELELEQTATHTIRALSSGIKQRPDLYSFTLVALDFFLGPNYKVIVVGDIERKDTLEILEILRKQFVPGMVLSLKNTNEANVKPSAFEWSTVYEEIDGKATVYICKNQTCLPPANNMAEVLEILEARK